MISDDDRDIDIESDAENDSDSRTHARNSLGGSGYYSQAEKRAHHNALERKRRDHIKDSFTSLRDSVPALQGEKVLCGEGPIPILEWIRAGNETGVEHFESGPPLKFLSFKLPESVEKLMDTIRALDDGILLTYFKEIKASRAQILKKAAEYIQFMRRKNNSHQQDIEDLKRQNNLLESQIKALEKVRATGNYMDAHELGLGIKSEGSSHDTDSSDGEGTTRRVKKLKINGVNV